MMICPKPINSFTGIAFTGLVFTGLAQATLLVRAAVLRLVAVFTLISGLVIAGSSVQAVEFPQQVIKVTTGKGVFFFKTEIATTLAQRQQGLMHRQTLADDAAMLFIWPQPLAVSMWMKDTFVSLDMVFIDKSGRVTNIGHATTPRSLMPVSSKGNVVAVLEVIAGTADRIGLKAGDVVWLP